MIPLSNTWHCMDTIKQKPPQDYGHMTATPSLSPCWSTFFGVNYAGKEHYLRLKAALEQKYKVTTYWDGKIYVGISLT